MDNRQYLTVAEFAEAEGITKQRVYQLLNKRLKPFVQEVEGVKVIDSRALSRGVVEQALHKGTSTFAQGFAQPIEQEVASNKTTELDLLKHSIDLLAAQIAEKDRMINELQRMNEEKDQHIQEQSKEFAQLLRQAQELQRNGQVLLAQREGLEQVGEQVEQERKPGFLKRLFGQY